LYALESIFVLRRVEISGGVKSKTYYFEDQAESHFFNKDQSRMSSLEGIVFRHLRAQCNYGLKVIEGDIPSPSEKQSANSYLRKTPNSKVLFVSASVKDFNIVDSNRF
jgi:hypothetical protein